MIHLEPLKSLQICCKIKKWYTIVKVRNDQGSEFENNDFIEFFKKSGVNLNFFALRTLQQNGVVERKNRCLKEMARTILNESPIPKTF